MIAGLVLAGGAGRRLGGVDKPLLALGAGVVLDAVLARLGGEGLAALALSANGDPARFARFGLPVLDDGVFAGRGPLAGVLAGLDWAAARGAAALLTVPGDTPFLAPGLVAGLSPPPAYAWAEERAQPLVALWPVAARVALRAWLAGAGAARVGAFAAGLGARAVAFAGAPAGAFANINTAEDLAAARARASPRCDAGTRL